MAPVSGLLGSVVITQAGTVPGTAAIVGMSEWNLDIGHDPVETTAFGDEWKQFIKSLREWSGSFSGNMETDASATTLRNAQLGGSVVYLRLYTGTATYYSGSAYLSGQSPTISVDGKGEDGWDFQGTGTLTYV